MPRSKQKRSSRNNKHTPYSSRPNSNNKSTPQVQPLYLWNSWKDVKNAVQSGQLKVGHVLKMKGLKFHEDDTNIKTEEAMEEELPPENGKVDVRKVEEEKMGETSQSSLSRADNKPTKKSNNSMGMRSASGKIKHHGIVLEIAEDKIRLAATATFGASKKLTKTVSKTSMKYYLPVEPAELEEGMLYGPIKMEEGVEKEKWVYRRWAHWFEFKTLIQNDKGNGASVQGPTGDVYSEETVKNILSCILSDKSQGSEDRG